MGEVAIVQEPEEPLDSSLVQHQPGFTGALAIGHDSPPNKKPGSVAWVPRNPWALARSRHCRVLRTLGILLRFKRHHLSGCDVLVKGQKLKIRGAAGERGKSSRGSSRG